MSNVCKKHPENSHYRCNTFLDHTMNGNNVTFAMVKMRFLCHNLACNDKRWNLHAKSYTAINISWAHMIGMFKKEIHYRDSFAPYNLANCLYWKAWNMRPLPLKFLKYIFLYLYKFIILWQIKPSCIILIRRI